MMYTISAHLYDTTSGFDNPLQIAHHFHRGLELAGQSPPGQLLDLGCGTGVISTYLERLGWTVSGIDRSDAMLNIAKAKSSTITWQQADITHPDVWKTLPGFDAVLCVCNTLNHLPADRLPIIFSGVLKVLNPNGVWLFDTDTYRMFQECLDHEPLVVWEDNTQRMIRACQFDSVTAQAHHTTRLEHLAQGKLTHCQTETHTLYYHPEHPISQLAQRTGFNIRSVEPLNPFDDEDSPDTPDDEAVYKLLWVLQKPL